MIKRIHGKSKATILTAILELPKKFPIAQGVEGLCLSVCGNVPAWHWSVRQFN